MATSATNRKNIKKNRRAIFEVEATVTSNRAKAYATRSIIEENRALILKNYTAAFMGNRQLANQNTDDVFRNRKAIKKSSKIRDLHFFTKELECNYNLQNIK